LEESKQDDAPKELDEEAKKAAIAEALKKR